MFHAKHDSGGGLKGVWRGSKRGLTRATAPYARASGVLAMAMLAACFSPEAMASQTAIVPPPAPPPPPAPAPGVTTFTDKAAKGEAIRDFAYEWPAAVSAVPALVERFTAERDRILADQKQEWDSALAEFSAEDCGGCVNRSFEKTWQVVANLTRFLSLSATFWEYSGGAHGNGAFDALVWDRTAKQAIDPKAMFRSPQALQNALGAGWCKALKTEKKARLGPDYYDDGFFPCPPVSDLTVMVGSSNRRAFNRIGLIAAPYVAGAYAEGTYEATLPVTRAVLAAVKPEYRAAFAPGK